MENQNDRKCPSMKKEVVSFKWCELARHGGFCGSCQHNTDNRTVSVYQEKRNKDAESK